jgi:DNA invertase Pin-like site-specific DNA recombinase
MIYGYARVSTGAQDLTSQLAELKAAGCEKVFREKITGTTAERPQLRKLMAAPRPAILSSPRRLTASRAMRPTFW